jgi:hypothetical protein
MQDNIVTFPGLSAKRGRANPVSSEPQEDAPKKVHWRSREHIREDIEMHYAARDAYGKAVAWEAAAESENLPPAQIEEARKQTVEAFEEMRYRGRNLVVVMPTDRRARRSVTLPGAKLQRPAARELWPLARVRLVANHAPLSP